MKATCPNNPEHKEFITVAHVMQDWRVDENGGFLENLADLQVDAGPHPLNGWVCAICGVEAHVDSNG